MAAEPHDVDIDAMTAEEFAALVHDSSDDEVLATFRAVGVAEALDRIFEIMQDHFVPERAGGTTGAVQMRIKDDDDTHHYVIELEGESCSTHRGTADDPRTTITTDLVRFTRIAVGQADGVKLLLRRKLKASGDINLARKVPGFFDIPEP